MEGKNKNKIPANKTVTESVEAAKIIADLAKEALKFGKSSDYVTKADQQSSSEYNASLSNTLQAINKEISDCNDSEERLSLYKQREDILNRLREEKENQRQFNNQREEEDRNQANSYLAIVTAVVLGAGVVATKYLLGQKKA